MQTITGTEITVRRQELADALQHAIENHNAAETTCELVRSDQRRALWFAAVSGHYLLKCKRLVPVGDWLDWVQLNFCAPSDCSMRSASRYMLIATVNSKPLSVLDSPRVANGAPDLEILSQFKEDTIRKHAIGFVPEKTQPQHKGNKKFSRSANCLNIANEYKRIKQRHQYGLQRVDFEEARQELRELYTWLQWLYGDAQANPWNESPPTR
jgi:hypothetical protein